MLFSLAYTLFESGITGPSYTIGGSSSYHIDSKFHVSLGEDKARELFEVAVRRYNQLGRQVEFSNRGVSGVIYNLELPEAQRAVIFRRAYRAHAPRRGWYSLDYYAPLIGTGRWHPSAQRAPIFAVTYAGGTRRSGFAWNYGFYSAVYDASGKLIAKVGHGDNRYPTNSSGIGITHDGGITINAPFNAFVVEEEPEPELSPYQLGLKYEQILQQQY